MNNFKNLLNNKKVKYLFYFLLAIILVIFISIKDTGKSKKQIPIETIPTPIITISPIISKTTIIPVEGEGLGTPDFYESQKPTMVKNYPLFDYLPYESDTFYLNYLKPFTLEAIIKENTPQAKQEVLNWISSKGVDPGTHTILWKIE